MSSCQYTTQTYQFIYKYPAKNPDVIKKSQKMHLKLHNNSYTIEIQLKITVILLWKSGFSFLFIFLELFIHNVRQSTHNF